MRFVSEGKLVRISNIQAGFWLLESVMERQRKSIPAEWKFYKEYSFINLIENMASETGHVKFLGKSPQWC